MSSRTAARLLCLLLVAATLAGADCEGNVNDDDVLLAVTVLASLNSSREQGDEASFECAAAGGGRYVAFVSLATNFTSVSTTFGRAHIYLRDMRTGTTRLVTVSPVGTEADGDSLQPSLSWNGRYIAFTSAATNLVAGGTTPGRSHIYVRDMELGVTVMVTANTSGGEGGSSGTGTTSANPSLSFDGTRVAFESDMGDLNANAVNSFTDIFVRDLGVGVTYLASRASGNGSPESLGTSSNPCLSGDGRFVVFETIASDIDDASDPDPAADGYWDIYIRQLEAPFETRLVSRAAGSTGTKGDGQSHAPVVSETGRYVAFESEATNLVAGDDATKDIFVRDMLDETVEVVTVHTSGARAVKGGEQPSISADGQLIAFSSADRSLVDDDSNGETDSFVRDRRRGTTERVSVATYGFETHPFNLGSSRPAISGNGRYVFFDSNANDVVDNDFNLRRDIFRRGPIR